MICGAPTGPKGNDTPPPSSPEPKAPFEPRPLTKPAGDSLGYMSWLKRFVRARFDGTAWRRTGSGRKGQEDVGVPAVVTEKTESRVSIASALTAYVDEQTRRQRWGLGPEDHRPRSWTRSCAHLSESRTASERRLT